MIRPYARLATPGAFECGTWLVNGLPSAGYIASDCFQRITRMASLRTQESDGSRK
jgi:hypothetical protein